ncbi:MAG: arsenate reductase ArsC [Candidatus Nanopelagicales bacterium]
MDRPDPTSVLFLCTHNSARSILGEAYLNHVGGGRFIAHSAGSTPRSSGQPNPLALRTLQEAGIDTQGLRSKSWSEFRSDDAPRIDLVVTVCGAADQAWPVFPGAPAMVQWGYDDPSAGDAPDAVKLQAFQDTLDRMRRRIDAFVTLPDEALTPHRIADSARRLSDV